MHGTIPGLALSALIATAGFSLHQLPLLATLSPMILTVVIGIVIRNTVGLPKHTKAGIAFSTRRVLRLAIVLLGLQLTASQILELGGTGLVVIVVSLATTFAFTIWFANVLGVDRKMACLIGAGTSVCGASAVVAANTVAGAGDEDVTYAVASVTVLGSIAMFVYPPLASQLGLGPHDYGLWAGASIHEIAQVVAASFQHGQDAGEFGTLTKLARVILLGPLVLALGFWLIDMAANVLTAHEALSHGSFSRSYASSASTALLRFRQNSEGG